MSLATEHPLPVVHPRPAPVREPPRFLDVRQVAAYLNLNEKKVYALVAEGQIPATKVTGKWVFPRELIDRWILDSSHGGVLSDRLLITGAGDPLLQRVTHALVLDHEARALVSYCASGTRLGLDLLQAHRADACVIHWGPTRESHLRHPALLGQYQGHRRWALIRAFSREQGLLLRPNLCLEAAELGDLLRRPLRWMLRQQGTGSGRALHELLAEHRLTEADLRVAGTALSDAEAAASIALGQADIAPGPRACATGHGLCFVSTGWEAVDLVLERGIYFRGLFQALLARIAGTETAAIADVLGGYDLTETGRLVWGLE